MPKLLPVPRRLRFWAIRESKRIAWSLFLLVAFIICIDSLGFIKFYFERDFETEFRYPLDVPNFPELIRSFRNGEQMKIRPINQNYSKITFDDKINFKCDHPIGLLILVKSAPRYFEKRAVIRATWGDPAYLHNISRSMTSSPLTSCIQENERKIKRSLDPSLKPVFKIRLVFLIGQQNDMSTNARNSARTPRTTTTLSSDTVAQLDNSIESQFVYNNNRKDTSSQIATALLHHSQAKERLINKSFEKIRQHKVNSIDEEILKYNDIIRTEFVDSYVNNTIKTMMGIRFAVEKCPDFQFSLLVDDDMYINLKNLIRYLENPREYPFVSNVDQNFKDSRVNEITCNTPTPILYAGKVLTTRPVRYKLVSKWYLSLQEYPFNYFPPYMPAAAIVMSKSVVEDFYWASFYTEHFRFDDVFLGLLAYKMNITPTNSNYFYVCHSPNGKCSNDDTGHDDLPPDHALDPMKYIIARHGLPSAEELFLLWQDQKNTGNVYS